MVPSLFAGLLCIQSCQDGHAGTEGYLHKDLSEQMDALAVYQGAIGEEIKRGNAKETLWLVDGMDSVLLLICDRLNDHQNLRRPFRHFYEQKLEATINNLRKSIQNGDTAVTHQQYRLLVKKCNSCHNEHDVEERAHY